MAEGLTREEFIQQYGFDPLGDPTQPQSRGGVTDHLRSLAVGAASIPTDLLQLPQVVKAGVKSAYTAATSDTPFLEQFSRELQVEGGPEATQQHLIDYSNALRQQRPNASQAEIDAMLKEYQESKQFEDFTREQLKGGAYAASTARNTIRGLLGDERPESERSWTESGAEVLGGALVGGPTGVTKSIANAAARRAATNAIFNNPVSRGALKTAEMLTPLTMPYTGTNVALNAGVGIAIDQAIRGAQGKSTAFTPTDDDSAGIASLGGYAAAAGASAAFIGAVRGRTNAALEAARRAQNQISEQLDQTSTLGDQIQRPMRPGEASIVAGPERELGPTAILDTQSTFRQQYNRFINNVFDEGYVSERNVVLEHGPEAQRPFEAMRMSHTGPVNNDRIDASVDNQLRETFDSIRAMPTDKMREDALTGAQMSSYYADIRHTIQTNTDQLAKLNEQLDNVKGDAKKAAPIQAKIDEIEDRLERYQADLYTPGGVDASIRQMMPETPLHDVRLAASAFENSTEPHVVRFRNALRKASAEQHAKLVKAGRISATESAEQLARNPYGVPNISADVATRTHGLWRSVNKSGVKITRSGGSPIGTRIPDVDPDAPETRITSLLDVRSAMRMNVERNEREIAKTLVANDTLRQLYTGPDGGDSAAVRNGNMRVVTSTNIGAKVEGDGWFDVSQFNTGRVRDLAEHGHIVPEWQNGRVRFWHLGDHETAAMLRQDPVVFGGLMRAVDASSQLFKLFTTGKGNPAFALKAMLYDLAVGMATHNAGRSFGRVSYLAHRFLPSSVAKHTAGRLVDPTAAIELPWHIIAGISNVTAYHMARSVARQLQANAGPFAAFARVVGARNFERMLETSLRIASKADNWATIDLMRKGATHGATSVDDIAKVRTLVQSARERVPAPVKQAYRFYSDIIDSIYMAPKRMFYVQNRAIMRNKLKRGKITKEAFDEDMKLLEYETRTIGGDMSRVPASQRVREIEAAFPYLTQTKLGTYHLLTNMFSPKTASYVMPRLALMTYGVIQSYYMMTNWDDNSRADLWKHTAEHERYRTMYIPTMETLARWMKGEKVPYTRDAVYKITIAPDFTGIIAGTTAMMQAMGIIPSDVTPKPLTDSLLKTVLGSFIPAMPPIANALAAQSGMKLDVQQADVRGGNWLRSMQSPFNNSPNAMNASNLGEMSNSTSLMMSALFGAMGGYMAQSTDILLHAAKSKQQTGLSLNDRDDGLADGIRSAMGNVVGRLKTAVPDMPLIWQGKDKYMATTPAWEYVAENNQHIRSIVGMRNEALGKTAIERRQQIQQAGGVTPRVLADAALLHVADEIAKFQRPTGMLGQLNKQYNELVNLKRGIDVQHKLTFDERQRRSNELMRKMHDNKEQQYLAVKYLEQHIAAKYMRYLQPKLRDRPINMQTLNDLMKESIGQ